MGNDGRLFAMDGLDQLQNHVTQKTRPNIKNLARTNLDIVP